MTISACYARPVVGDYLILSTQALIPSPKMQHGQGCRTAGVNFRCSIRHFLAADVARFTHVGRLSGNDAARHFEQHDRLWLVDLQVDS